jgi:hypothetical protein
MSSDSESSVAITVPATQLETIVESVKTLNTSDLFKLLKVVLSETEKKTKLATKKPKATKGSEKPEKPEPTKKKTGSMPRGEIPSQLLKPRAWVEYTQKNANESGWESFVIHQTRKNKETGEKIEETIAMPASVKNSDGKHVYEGSITEENPSGRSMIYKEVMSLSKHRKATEHSTYKAFEASYVPPTNQDTTDTVLLSSDVETATESDVPVKKTKKVSKTKQ